MNYSIPEFKASTVDEGFGPGDTNTIELYEEVEAFARHGQPILIFGPTGAGKEFLARHYYNTLIKSEFYGQYRDNWPLKFEEIITKYSKHYSKKEIEVFVNSIRTGVFESINSATIYPTLAESILFGHEANLFNDARTSPGLLESIKHGVLFMDEIGDLPKDLQAKMLRAVDSEISEGRRMGGKMDYSLKDITIIAATNRPRNKIRDDFYYKIGNEVEIKGIDERPKDVRKSIPHFIAKALGKRKDYAAVISMFGLTINDIKSITRLSEAREVRNFAKSLGDSITGEILARKWPGNFRALRRAIESSVIRIESPDHLTSFSENFQKHFHYYVSKYSEETARSYAIAGKSPVDVIYPSRNPEMDLRIQKEFQRDPNLRDIDNTEKKILSIFLSKTYETGFIRKDIEECYRSTGSIRYISEAHIRSRINKLIALNILVRTGEGKSIMYSLAKGFLNKVKSKPHEIFSLPEVSRRWSDRSAEIKVLAEMLSKNDRLYIEASAGFGKTAFISMFCNTMKEKYNFYYYPLGEAGIKKMFEDIIKLLQHRKVRLDAKQILEDPVSNLHAYNNHLFNGKSETKPVLIIDNVHFVSDPDGVKTIIDLTGKWKEVIMILIGDRMDNAFVDDFVDFPLGPWGKES